MMLWTRCQSNISTNLKLEKASADLFSTVNVTVIKLNSTEWNDILNRKEECAVDYRAITWQWTFSFVLG
jgi:hypothetical protein